MGIKQWIFHEVALLVHYFQVELEFGMLVFVTGGKPELRTRKKTLGARMRTNHKLNPISRSNWNLECWFSWRGGGGKPEDPGKKPSEQGWEPTTNSNHMWNQVQEWNPGHSGWKASVFTSAPAPLPIKDLSKFTRRSIEVGRTDTSAHWTRAINPLFWSSIQLAS